MNYLDSNLEFYNWGSQIECNSNVNPNSTSLFIKPNQCVDDNSTNSSLKWVCKRSNLIFIYVSLKTTF